MSKTEDERVPLRNPRVQDLSANDDEMKVSRTSDVNMVDDEKAAKRKKMIKWIIIGSAITVCIILAIVLPIVLTKSSNPDDPVPPGPPPVPPFNFEKYNPYKLESSTADSESVYSGRISAAGNYSAIRHL
jgi:flagellar basal body-associated protein FliL